MITQWVVAGTQFETLPSLTMRVTRIGASYKPTRISSGYSCTDLSTTPDLLTSEKIRENSRTACINSSTALLDLHRQLCEMPRLRCYRWLVLGMTSFNALHGAIALTSCLLDTRPVPDETSCKSAIEATTNQITKLRTNSLVCAYAHLILTKLQ